MSGRLIVLEGLDGSGKATQTGLLCDRLTDRHIPHRRLSFPDYAGPAAPLIKGYLSGEFGERPGDIGAYIASSFYAVDRAAGFLRDWGRDYRAGLLLVADRYTTSNAVHQMSKLPPDEWEDYLRWQDDYEYTRMGLPRPDLVFWLDMPPEVSRSLLLKREGGALSDLHERDLAYLEDCRVAARFAAERLQWRTIPCAEEGRPRRAEEIHTELLDILQKAGLIHD